MKKVALISAVALVAAAGAAFAFSNNPNGDGQGQANAAANCFENIDKQQANGLIGKNKNKIDAPTNCDHFYN